MKPVRLFLQARQRARQRTGAILILVMATLLLLLTLTIGLFSITQWDGIEASHSLTKMNAYWAAEAGIEHAKTLAQLRRIPFEYFDYPTGSTNFLWGANVLRGTTANGSYIVDIVSDPAWTNAAQALKKYIIKSHGTSKVGDTQTITLAATIQNYASYVWASNYERDSNNNPIWFRGGDILDGAVYVNDYLNIWYQGSTNPVFLQLASSASNAVYYQSASGNKYYSSVADNNVFQGRLALNVPKLDIAGTFTSDHVQDVKIDAQRSGGLILSNGNCMIVFKPNGQFTYQFGTIVGSPPSPGFPPSISLSGAIKTNNLLTWTNGMPIYVTGSAFVQGTINGKATIAAQDSIYIATNIVYASAVNPSPWAGNFNVTNVTDKLGLIASNQVMVTANITTEIHAAIMVTSGSHGSTASAYDYGFNAYPYWNKPIGNAYLKVFGGITQYRRSAVGSGTSLGFAKNYKFDTRFLTDAPPYFPYSIYVFSNWKQSAN